MAIAMTWIAWRMLIGNRGKYLGIVLGIAFAALLIAQQASIFCGLMYMTTSQIQDVQGVDIWVMDPNVEFIDDIKPLSENDLFARARRAGRRSGPCGFIKVWLALGCRTGSFSRSFCWVWTTNARRRAGGDDCGRSAATCIGPTR